MEDKVCIDGIWYELDEVTKTVVVIDSDNVEEKYQGDVVIPEVIVYDGIEYSVTDICGLAFYLCSDLKSIIIPKSVEYIGSGASCHCSGLTSIIVAENNAIYDSRNGCNAIIETSSNMLIAGCAKTIITDSATKIGPLAFCGCSGLTSITIPESVEEIGYLAFSRCSGLTSIIVAKNNAIYDSRNDCNAIIETKTNKLIAGCAKTIIPNNVTSIEDFTFSGCHALESITIPEGVELEIVPIVKEAFVFFVNKNNPVENFELSQIQNILFPSFHW